MLPVMNKWTIDKLDSLLKDLDIFIRRKPADPELINLGLYPPLPVAGNYLIHGFSILEKAKEVKIKQLNVIELPVKTKKEILYLCLKYESNPGKYSWIEIEKMISFLGEYNTIDEKIIRLISGHEDSLFHEKVNIYKGFSESLKKLVGENILDFKTAMKISHLPDDFFFIFSQYNKKNKLSFSERKIFLLAIDEIIRRDDVPKPEAVRMCKNLLSKKNPIDAVRKLRYPELSELYRKLQAIKDEYINRSGIKLCEPPFFEGSSFEIRFSFQSKKQLKKQIKVLENLMEKADELLALL